jgi:hypothetical protein
MRCCYWLGYWWRRLFGRRRERPDWDYYDSALLRECNWRVVYKAFGQVPEIQVGEHHTIKFRRYSQLEETSGNCGKHVVDRGAQLLGVHDEYVADASHEDHGCPGYRGTM